MKKCALMSGMQKYWSLTRKVMQPENSENSETLCASRVANP